MVPTSAERSLRVIDDDDDGSMESIQAQVLSWLLDIIDLNVVSGLMLCSSTAFFTFS